MNAIPLALAASLALAGPALAADATTSGTTNPTRTQDREQVRSQAANHRQDEVRRAAAADREHDRTTSRGQAGTHGTGPCRH